MLSGFLVRLRWFISDCLWVALGFVLLGLLFGFYDVHCLMSILCYSLRWWIVLLVVFCVKVLYMGFRIVWVDGIVAGYCRFVVLCVCMLGC